MSEFRRKDDLRAKCKEHGVRVGPLNASMRKIYAKKLAAKLVTVLSIDKYISLENHKT